MMSLMGFCLTYCRTFLQMLNDGLRNRGKRYEGGEPECEGRNTGDQMCAVVGAPSQGDESMRLLTRIVVSLRELTRDFEALFITELGFPSCETVFLDAGALRLLLVTYCIKVTVP